MKSCMVNAPHYIRKIYNTACNKLKHITDSSGLSFWYDYGTLAYGSTMILPLIHIDESVIINISTMKRRICTLFVSILFLGILQSCQHPFRILGECSSPSIGESKTIGTFLFEYIPGHIKINDSIQFTIKQVFAEKQYGYYSHLDPSYTIKNSKSQIVVIFDKKLDDIKGYSYTWRFTKLRYDIPKRSSIEFNDSIPPDSVQIDIIRRDINYATGLAGNKENEKIGHFTIHKDFTKNTH